MLSLARRSRVRSAALALAVIGGTLAGCARVALDGSRATTRGATVRFDVAADPANLNPLFAHADAGNVEQQLAHLAFEPFYDLDSHGKPVPELITEIPSLRNGGLSADARTLVYHLRPQLRWSDGVALTARDVLFTLHAILDPHNPVGSHAGYELIDRADAPDAHTVRFHLRHAWAPALATFFTYGTNPQYVLPEHVLAKQGPLEKAAFNASPSVGDGPFAFVAWQRGDRLTYAPNPHYWRGVSPIARVDVRIVPDPGTNLTLLQSGELDFNLVAPSQQATLLKNATGLQYAYAPTALIAGVAFNLAHPPLDDARVRRAIVAAIDRTGISKKITLGRYPVAQSDRPRFSFAYDPSVAEPAYDIAAADRDLDASGWRRGTGGIRRKGGHALALTYVQFPESTTGVRVAAVVQRELFERGIDVTIKSISNAQLFLPARDGGALASGKFDLAYVPWAMGADPDDRFLLGCTGGVKNYMHYCDRDVDALETLAAAEPDRAKRKARYVAIDRRIARDVPIAYLFNPEYIYAHGARLRGFEPNAFVPTWNAYAWSIR